MPPTAVLLRDPSHKEYDSWDLRLAAAYHIHQDVMRGNVPLYWDESDRVAFDVKVGVSKSRAAIDRREERDQKNKTPLHGRYYYAVPRSIDGGPLPTMSEWAEERSKREGGDRTR